MEASLIEAVAAVAGGLAAMLLVVVDPRELERGLARLVRRRGDR